MRDYLLDIPLDLDHAFGGKFNQTWTVRRVDRDPTANRDEAHDVVPRYRIAAASVTGHDIFDATHLDPTYLMWGGLFWVWLRWLLPGLQNFLGQQPGEHLDD